MGPHCLKILADASGVVMSAATYAECQVVGLGKATLTQVTALLDMVGPEIVPIGAAQSHLMLAAYRRWGKGIHRAKLNIFDCFAYALAVERDLPLLYIGDDFAQTDVRSALTA